MKGMEGKTVTWETYLKELREQFIEGVVSKPLIELRNLRQTATVSEYNHKFNSLRKKVTISPDMLLDLYVGGLTPEIMHTVQLLDPKSLSQAMKMAKATRSGLLCTLGVGTT